MGSLSLSQVARSTTCRLGVFEGLARDPLWRYGPKHESVLLYNVAIIICFCEFV